MAIIPAQPVESDDQGNLTFHLASTAANDDWIRSARLVEEGDEDELQKLNNTKMVKVIQESQ